MVVQGSLATAGRLGIKIRVGLTEVKAPRNCFGSVFAVRPRQKYLGFRVPASDCARLRQTECSRKWRQRANPQAA